MADTLPGHVFTRDYRASRTAPPPGKPLKLLQWNIERGYKLNDGLIEELKRIDADVLSLQEVDIGCERSGGVDVGDVIARALGLQYVFLCEFQELHSPLRCARDQGGGVHGNALLSRYDLTDVRVVEHSHWQLASLSAPA